MHIKTYCHTPADLDMTRAPSNAPAPGFYRLSHLITNPQGRKTSKRNPVTDAWEQATLTAGTLVYVTHTRDSRSAREGVAMVDVEARTPSLNRYRHTDTLNLGTYRDYQGEPICGPQGSAKDPATFHPDPRALSSIIRGSLAPCDPSTLTRAEIQAVFAADDEDCLTVLLAYLDKRTNIHDWGGVAILHRALTEAVAQTVIAGDA